MSETSFWLISPRSTAFTEELPQKTLHLTDYLISRSNRWEVGEGGGGMWQNGGEELEQMKCKYITSVHEMMEQ